MRYALELCVGAEVLCGRGGRRPPPFAAHAHRPFPTLKITSECRDIDKLCYADLKLEGYKPHKSIKMKMAV